MQRVGRAVLFFFLMGLTLASCTRAPDVVKIGLVAPFEGTHRDVGYDAIYAARLAIREINSSGGIHGTKLALVALDDGGSLTSAEQNARLLTLDPAVVAVVGHGLPETTSAAQSIYTESNLPLIPLPLPPFNPFPTENLPVEFTQRYQAVTPFDEEPGPLAAPTYDAFQLIFATMTAISEQNQPITRNSMTNYLPNSAHQGITGPVELP